MCDNCNYSWREFPCSLPSSTSPAIVASYDKAEWQRLMQASANNGNNNNAKSISYIRSEDLSYDEFFHKNLLKNLPCMFSPSLTASWLSCRFWSVAGGESGEGGESSINYDYLLGVYGDAPVSAVNCNDSEYREGYGTRDCRDMTFRDYIEYFKETIVSRETSAVSPTPEEWNHSKNPCLYLKDWHIVRFHKSLTNATTQQDNLLPYQCPVYFQSDWLNEFCDDRDYDDYKFCYMGPKGSFTSFHADVYGSYSWSANVLGVKKWHLYPPGKEMRFYGGKKLSFRWDDPGVEGEDYMEVIQKPGECLFVPSGWHHVVWNLTDAVSINHNWFNGANLCYIWSVLQNALYEVEKELDDLRDIPEFHETCQLVLKANHGLNYKGFFETLTHIMEKRLKCLKEDDKVEATSSATSWHARFDMDAILHVVQEHCLQDPIVQKHFSELMQTFTNKL